MVQEQQLYMSPLSCSHGIMSHTLSFCILKHFADASSMTFMWTPAFVNTVLDDLKELQLAVRSGKCGFCFVSRNVSSVVETVNAVGLSDAGSGTLNDQWALFPAKKTWDPYSPDGYFLCGFPGSLGRFQFLCD